MQATLLDNVTADEAAPTSHKLHDSPGRNTKGVVQAKITGTLTCTVQGSHDNTNWVDIQAITASAAYEVTLFPYMRCIAAGIGGGEAATVWLSY